MTDLIEAFNISLNHPGEDDLTDMRANWRFLQMIIGAVGIRDGLISLFIPQWATTVTTTDTGSPLDYSEPTEVLIARTYTDVSPNVTEQYKYLLTWTSGNMTQIIYQYDDGGGGGFTTVTGGTITITYSAGGHMTGATSA